MKTTPHARGGQHHNRCCSRRALFVWSFCIFVASLLLVNLSFASGYRSMQLGTYMLLSPGKLRNVLELDSKSSSLPMELTPDAELVELPLNASTMAQMAVSEGDQHKFDSLNKVDPLAREADILAQGGSSTPAGDPVKRSSTGTRLVVYVFQNRDSDAVRNFEYFLANGLGSDDQTDYVIIVQQLQAIRFLPAEIGKRAVVEEWADCTAPWGVYKWALDRYDAPSYKHYVLLTSAVQGPMLPKYFPKSSWIDIFTSRLSDTVKMVGPVISCQSIARGGDVTNEWRTNPHVTQEMVVLDKEGLNIIRSAQEVMQCYGSPYDAKYHSESGASRAILEAGKNIDSLMLRYGRVDWANKANWQCNGGVRPSVDLSVDGIGLNPLELVFVEVNSGFLHNSFPSAVYARKYAEWQHRRDVVTNEWHDKHWALKAPRLAITHARGPGCFDSAYYAKQNPDVGSRNLAPWELWEHYVSVGQFEGRQARYSCEWAVGRTHMTAYYKNKGPACFDFKYYMEHSTDLRSLENDKRATWEHFINLGLFEDRNFRFTCTVDYMLAGQYMPDKGLLVQLGGAGGVN